MSAKLDTYHPRGSDVASLAPSYTTQDYNNDIELSRLGELEADSLSEVPPAYSESTSFTPAVQLQIQTTGKAVLSFPFPQRPETIPAIPVHPDGTAAGQPRYLSVRPVRSSGSCYLVSGDPTAPTGPAPLSTTTYRFGPGRPPQVHLFLPGTAGTDATKPDDEQPDDESGAWDSFAIEGQGLLTRAQRMRSRLGTFEWRYASRAERKAIGADSLLILDRVVRVVRARNGCGGGKDEDVRTPVAQFVRNAETRSPGSRPSSAGNGGRLLVDLGMWDESEKLEREMIMVLVMTTLISMLKKEVDRRRAQQIAVMAGAAGGG